jgi:hypothetical protein
MTNAVGRNVTTIANKRFSASEDISSSYAFYVANL